MAKGRPTKGNGTAGPKRPVKKYPEVLGGVEIGNGKVRMNIPVINKVVEFDTDDIKTLKETLIAK